MAPNFIPSGTGLFVDGSWRTADQTLEVRDKYRQDVIGRLAGASEADVRQAVLSARAAQRRHRLDPIERHRILRRASELIERDGEGLATLIAREGGKPLKLARVEVSRAVQTFLISAEEAKRITGEMVPIDAAPGQSHRLAFTLRVPVGVVAAISPFNFPLNLVAHKVAPALAAGNAVVLKPASATPLSAVALLEILLEAGLPPGLIQLVVGSGSTVGEWLLADPGIDFFTFTGSPAVGRRIKEASGLRRVALELGSNSAAIVHEDADLDRTADRLVPAAFAHAGQVCISLQRLYVHRAVWEPFLERFLARTARLSVGDPLDPATDVGPMIDPADAERARAWIDEALAHGARRLTGSPGEGAIIHPTVLSDVPPDLPICCQEAFAPVVVAEPYDSLDQAIERVNASRYGLQAGVFTRSLAVALEAARRLEVGGVMIGDSPSFRADVMPYGGVKESGMGREGPRYAIREMTEERLVVIDAG